MTAPQIGVLLPVRLETRFAAPAGAPARWRLRVRVVPDAVSITMHDELASTVELDARRGDVARRRRRGPRVARGAAGVARARRRGRGGARCLAGAHVPAGRRPQTERSRSSGQRDCARTCAAPRCVGLPPALEIWIARGGQPAAQAATLTVLADEIDLDLDDPGSTSQPWWTSFAEAVRRGARRRDRPRRRRARSTSTRIYVVGIGGGDPGPLLTAQADSGRLGIVAPGSATSSVDGEDGGRTRRRRHVATARPGRPKAQAGTVAVSTAVAGLRACRRGRRRSPTIARSIGHSSARSGRLCGATRSPTSGATRPRRTSSGSGPRTTSCRRDRCPRCASADQPYGLLPATSLHRWRAADGDPEIEERLVPLVRGLVDTWAAAAERQAGQRDALRDLVHNPIATRYAWRWMIPTRLAHARVVPLQPARPRRRPRRRGGRGGRRRRRASTLRPRRRASSWPWAGTTTSNCAWQSPTTCPRAPTPAPAWPASPRRRSPSYWRPATAVRGRGARVCSPSWAATRCWPARPPWRGPPPASHGRSSSRSAPTRDRPRRPRSGRRACNPPTWPGATTRRRGAPHGRREPPDARQRGRRRLRPRRCAPRSTPPPTGSTRGPRASPGGGCRTSRRRRARSVRMAGSTRRARRRRRTSHRYVLAPSTEQAAVAAVLRDRALRDPDADALAHGPHL